MRRTFRKLLLIVAFAAVLFYANRQLPIAEATAYPTAKVTSVGYPPLVSSGATFQVTIRAEYSDKFLADIGIWDADEGLMVQSFTLISQFTGPGNATFNLSLTAPPTVGQWHLIAINRVWWQDAWYEDPNGGAMSFTVTVEGLSNNVTLTLGSVGTSTQIVVDNASYQIQNGSSIPLTLRLGPHSLQAPLIVQGDLGERYVFVGWSDDVNSDPRQISLTQPTSVSALYRTEYYLSAESARGQVVGEGWYEKGEQATVVITPTITVASFPGLIDEYRFNGWSGDSSSTSYVLTLRMDGPKQIDATWIKNGTTIGQGIPLDLLILGCMLLGARLVFVRYRQRDGRPRYQKGAGLETGLVCLMLCVLVVSTTFPTAFAQLPSPKASTVKIGDAEWYYWNRPGSDTCLLWLGGGIPEEAEPGSYGYLINPFDYESFGTIRFIQGLASYYCVLALQQGSTETFNPAANRTIYQELFTPQTSVIEAVHKWISEQGYQHTFVVGYSVGGEAATAELTLTQPVDWSTQDGLILITVPFGQDVIKNANELRTNLFMIYGGNLPDYEATGLQYFNSTQPEGLLGAQYFHKEFHVIADVGHEVWTIRATGDYDTQALNLIVGFIERSKALQIENSLESRVSNSTEIMTARIVSVQSPLKVAEGEPYVVQCNLSLNSLIQQPTILAAYEPGQEGILSETAITTNRTIARLVIPPISNSTELPLSLIVLQNSTGRWVQVSNTYQTRVTINNLVTLTIVTSVPGMVFSFDNNQFTTNSSGIIKILTAHGHHSLQMQPFVYFGNTSRLRFTGWDDSTNATLRQLDLNDNTTLHAIFTQQYFVQVSSPYGQTVGSGWYDAGSLATLLVQPPVLNEPPVFFSHWTAGMNSSQVRTLLPVTSPNLVEAVWNSTGGQPEFNAPFQNPWFTLSALAFTILLLLNVKTRRSKKK
ncbi:MAG: hypothetical protein ABSF63_02675 [Candidatus Bathyarchaeia archaeon]|jgi:hypothetical protein